MIRLECRPFVPGRARGSLVTREPGAAGAGSVVLVNAPSLALFMSWRDAPPDGVILRGDYSLSHVAIFLFSLNVPTVMMTEDMGTSLKGGDVVLLDGSSGLVIVNPADDTLANWEHQSAPQTQPSRSHVTTDATAGARTRDAEKVRVCASVSTPDNARLALQAGADAIGLLRSEFLFDSDHPPQQGSNYRDAMLRVCEDAGGLPVTVRLFDLGGEKVPSWGPRLPEMGSPLGLRGARVYECTGAQELLRLQISVLSELSEAYTLSALVPFVSSAEEFTRIRQRIDEIAPGGGFSVDAMLETPSACFSIPELAPMSSSLALGTNDLMQCFFGADRSIPEVAAAVLPYSPSLLRFLDRVSEMARLHTASVQVCGQLPLYPYLTAALIGVGFSAFSVEASAVSTLRSLIGRCDAASLRELVKTALSCSTAAGVRQLLEDSLEGAVPE